MVEILLTWYIGYIIIRYIIFNMFTSNKERKKETLDCIIFDIVLAVSDRTILCLGGNPGLHSIGVSMQIV